MPDIQERSTADLLVLVVDDESLAREGLVELLREQGVTRILQAPNGADAIHLIREADPDLVFLDVQMPRLTGFDVIRTVGASAMPPVIFSTAYDQHALAAFDVHAVDFLLKPVDPDRFRDAFAHARRQMERADLARLRTALGELTARLGAPVAPEPERARFSPDDPRIPIKDGGRITLVHPAEINWIEAVGNYVMVHVRAGALRHRATLSEMEQLLGPGFLRIRRSTLIRSAAVRYCEPLAKGSFVVVLHDQTRLTSSRHYREQLAPLLGAPL